MKDNTRLLVRTGFLTVLGLLFSLVFISLLQLHANNRRMEELVQVTSIKTAAVNEMREAIRLRADSLKTMMLAGDAFERDAEHQRFLGYAGKYRIAREQLVSLGMNAAENTIHEQLRDLTLASQPLNDHAADLLLSEAPAAEISTAMTQATALHTKMLDRLEQLVDLELRNTQESLAASRHHNASTRTLLFVLAGMALLFTLLVSRIVINRVSDKNRQLAYRTSHDVLTGLINRREFERRIERAMQQAKAQAATHALLHLDLDRFKAINDSYGHTAGDELLQQLAQLLLSSVRNRDTLSRLGGDEFGMLLENCPLDKAVDIAQNLLTVVDEFHFSWSNRTFTVGMSIGVVPIDRSTTDLATIMSAADSACYVAKQSRNSQVQVAQLGDRRLQERHGEMQWVTRLTRALEEDRFSLYYQPVIPCASEPGPGKHVEILLRMIEDDGSVVLPDTFLPVAGKYGLAANIDRWVIMHAMEWLAQHTSPGGWPLTLSINLTGQTIGNQDMLKFIISTMEETGIAPEQVIFDITETSAIRNIASATSFMLTLRGCGFRFALDDCGSGLSAFTYLKKLPVDFLKIDGAFVRDIMSDPVDYAMVRSINELGQLLGKETIAELVETLDVADELRRIGINYVQGYAYGKPEPLDNFVHARGPRLVVVSSRDG